MNEQNFSQIVSVLDSMIGAILFSPDGKLLAEAGFGSIKLRDARSGRELRTFGGRQVAAATAQFSPDGKLLVAGKHDGRLRIWDLASGTMLGDVPAHAGGVTALAFSRDGQWLASGSRDTTVLIWDWEQLRRQVAAPERQAVVPHEKLWADLAGNDAERARHAIITLARSPVETAAFLKERLRPVPAVDARRVEQLLADLDEREFNKRKKAEQELEKLGDLAAAAIKKRLAGSPTLEMARRLESLLRKVDSQEMSADVLQALRAIETLEMIASPAARQVLERVSQCAAGHRITEDARQTLRRLGRL